MVRNAEDCASIGPIMGYNHTSNVAIMIVFQSEQ